MAVSRSLAREALPPTGTAVLAAIAGLAGVIGIVGLYHGLAVGRMGVVAPVTGVLAAACRSSSGSCSKARCRRSSGLGSGSPSWRWSSSRAPAAASAGRSGPRVRGRRRARDRAVAGVPRADPRGITVLGAGDRQGVGHRPARRRDPRGPPLVAGPGPGVTRVRSASPCSTSPERPVPARRPGRRARVAATLSSLYPVVTVILAVAILHERVTRVHLVGIVVADRGDRADRGRLNVISLRQRSVVSGGVDIAVDVRLVVGHLTLVARSPSAATRS